MKHKINYTDGPIGKLKIVEDFLPTPAELSTQEKTVKITISLSQDSVEYFKKVAKKYKTPYQKMIRKLLDVYAKSVPA